MRSKKFEKVIFHDVEFFNQIAKIFKTASNYISLLRKIVEILQ